MQNNIIILPEDLVDKIAAGEVVERPASVVKELVENSIDSGAKNISVEIKKGGVKFIRVTDDGSGMDEKNSDLAFQRHGTSKIKSVDDLYRIKTLGFRGEALPSIASISLLDMLTRTKESLSGIRIKIEGGVIKDKREAGAPIGTSIIIREIFYNVPARRKFLKSVLTETRHIIDLLTRFAIAYPEISFKLTSDGRGLFDFKGLPHPLSPPLHKMERGTEREVQLPPQQGDLRQRVADIFGKNQMEKMVEMKKSVDSGQWTVDSPPPQQVNIFGFLGKPEIAKSNRAELYLFVNQRPISSRTLYHAVQIGFGELLPKGKFPFAIVFIEIDPGLVDVNVHPTKSEVRFSDERGMHNLVYSKIKECLTSPEVMPIIEPLEKGVIPSELSVDKKIRPDFKQPGMAVPPTQKQVNHPMFESSKTQEEDLSQKSFLKQDLVKHEPEAPIGEGVKKEEVEPAGRDSSPAVGGVRMTREEKLRQTEEKKGEVERMNLWQLADTYILSQVKGSLMVLDQHAAHERVLYEEAMKNLTQRPASSQQILFPTVLELSPKEFAILEEHKELIGKLGFGIKHFGGQSVLVTAVPALIKNKSGELFLKEILSELEEERKVEKNRVKAVAKSFACHGAIKAGDRLTKEEMSSLIHQLFATEEPYSCPHGRPTVVKISIDELNKKFGRS
ncbi:MAG: DNA mismatch repair endonuclease MutL [candidate division Zixibacteria bacterium]|nr:DNA mismatch repair endonuclease MutL [candidate division Zixibacteria bacterium]